MRAWGVTGVGWGTRRWLPSREGGRGWDMCRGRTLNTSSAIKQRCAGLAVSPLSPGGDPDDPGKGSLEEILGRDSSELEALRLKLH